MTFLKMQEQPDGSGLNHMSAFENVVRLLQPGSRLALKQSFLDLREDFNALERLSCRLGRFSEGDLNPRRQSGAGNSSDARAKRCDLDLCPS